jgi:endogenous inhibitor of DNA gyrase (YacG/DUF329 family)
MEYCPNCSTLMHKSFDGFCSRRCQADYEQFIDGITFGKPIRRMKVDRSNTKSEFIKELHQLLEKYDI